MLFRKVKVVDWISNVPWEELACKDLITEETMNEWHKLLQQHQHNKRITMETLTSTLDLVLTVFYNMVTTMLYTMTVASSLQLWFLHFSVCVTWAQVTTSRRVQRTEYNFYRNCKESLNLSATINLFIRVRVPLMFVLVQSNSVIGAVHQSTAAHRGLLPTTNEEFQKLRGTSWTLTPATMT